MQEFGSGLSVKGGLDGASEVVGRVEVESAAGFGGRATRASRAVFKSVENVFAKASVMAIERRADDSRRSSSSTHFYCAAMMRSCCSIRLHNIAATNASRCCWSVAFWFGHGCNHQLVIFQVVLIFLTGRQHGQLDVVLSDDPCHEFFM